VRSTTSPVLEPITIVVPAGEFTMGDQGGDKFATDTERPAHPVVLSRRFALGQNPVKTSEYRCFDPAHTGITGDDDDTLPVVNVSWNDASAYCSWLSEQTGRHFRLPTEAEWEYACRAGTHSPFFFGDELTPEQANFLYSEAGERVGPGRRLPPGSYRPNTYGFHDLHGNVCEWVEDHWHPNYLGAPTDGSAWLGGENETDRRIIRGGAWDYLPRLLRSAWRDSLPRSTRRDNVGFRVALTMEPAHP
jgi:formylglycine-generating enzyme required for sulfatase activity